MTHALDIDLMRDLGDRARALFGDVEMRMYTAALIGRVMQRIPYGAHRDYPSIKAGAPALLARNDSRERALLVYLQLPLGAMLLSDAPGAGGSSFVFSPQSDSVTSFVLRPGEALFGTPIGAAAATTVASEWY